jgi:hypothetical protein
MRPHGGPGPGIRAHLHRLTVDARPTGADLRFSPFLILAGQDPVVTDMAFYELQIVISARAIHSAALPSFSSC